MKRVEEDLNLQLKTRIQEFAKLEEEIMQFKKKLDEEEIMQFKKNIDEEAIKTKFEDNSKILDDMLNSQRP